MKITIPMPNDHHADGTPWWRLSDGNTVRVVNGLIYGPAGSEYPACAEHDALVYLAAARRALAGTNGVDRSVNREKGAL